jgi:hypothetical protein
MLKITNITYFFYPRYPNDIRHVYYTATIDLWDYKLEFDYFSKSSKSFRLCLWVWRGGEDFGGRKI